MCTIEHAQTDKNIVNKNIHFLCVNHLTKATKLFTIYAVNKLIYTTTKQEDKTMKTTLKEIRRYVATNAAEDLTRKGFAEIDAIRVAECGFDTIAYSTGLYGCTGVLVKGNTTGKLYAVTARTSALFQVM